MATIQDLGKVAYLNKGNYDGNTNYEINDVVSYKGSSYVSLVNDNKGNIPTNTNFWSVVAQSAYEIAVQNGYEGTAEEWTQQFLNADNYYNKAEINTKNNNLQSQINSLASGSPLVASSISGMTDTTKVYVLTTDGHWYYYDGSAWADGGVYQATEDSNTVDELAQDVNDLYINLFPLKNYLDYSNYEAGKYYKNNSVGTAIQIGSASGYTIVPPIKVKKNVTYQFANIPSVGTAFSKICDKDGIVLETYPGQAGNKFTPNYDGYAYITFTTSTPANYPYAMLYLDGYAPSGYVEYGKFYNLLMLNTNYIEMYNFYDSIKNLDFDKKHTTITVGNDKDYTTITSAIASISDASSSKIYDVMIDDGTYNEYSISLPNYVNLIGVSGNKDDCIIRGYLDPSVSDNGHRSISTIDLNSNNVLKDLTITAQNMRYPIHHESSGAVTDWETIVENCHIEHFGNQEIIDYRIEHNLDPGNVWSSPHAWGEGASSGAKLTIKDTTLKSVENAFYVHGASSMSKPYYHELINCKLITSHANQIAVYIDNSTSPLDNNTLIIKDCYIGGRIANIDSTTIYNCMVSGSGIKPVYQRPGHVCEEYDFPLFTDYVDEYVAGESISKGTFVYTTDGKTIYKANSTTNKKLIVGYVIGNKSTGDLTKVMKGYLQPSSQTWPETPMTSNKYYTINNNGLLEETNDLDSAIAISNNYAYKLFI